MLQHTLIGEIGINHNGSLTIAKQLIDCAKISGMKYVKFQKRDINLVYDNNYLNSKRESPWGTTNRQQKEGLEFGKTEYDEINSYCKEKNIKWFGSPWDIKSVDFLMQYNPEYIKVASAMLTNIPLLEKIKESIKDTDTKVIIATGMSTEEEIDNCLVILGNKIEYILSCTSSYPTPTQDMNINRIKTLQKKYLIRKIGFSNHSSGILFIIMAAVLGCKMIEYHITLDRTIYGSDQASSIEIPGMLKIKDYIENIEKSWGDGKIGCQPSEISIKEKLRK